MADEVKKEEEDNNTFGLFDNKYVRGGVAAVVAAIAAKNDPYLLEGFKEKIDEIELADRERRNAFIKTATEAATKEIARNKLKRLERREAAEPKIKRAVALGMNAYLAGQAYQTGELDTILKQKADKPDLVMDELYKVGKEYRGKIAGFSTNDVLEAIAGPTLKLQGLMDDIKAPKRQSFLRNFITGTDDDPTAKTEVEKNIALQQQDTTTTKPIDFTQASLSKRGRQFLSSVGKETTATTSMAKTDIARWVSQTMGLTAAPGKSPISISAGEFVFQSDNVENNKIAERITGKMLSEIEFLYGNVNSPAYNDRRMAMEIVKAKYEKYTPKGVTINIDAVNFNEKNKIMPDDWTPSTPTPDQIKKKKIEKKKSASNVYNDLLKKIDSIKNNSSLRDKTRERNKRLAQAKKIAINRIIAMMNENPPRATQADLDKVKAIKVN